MDSETENRIHREFQDKGTCMVTNHEWLEQWDDGVKVGSDCVRERIPQMPNSNDLERLASAVYRHYNNEEPTEELVKEGIESLKAAFVCKFPNYITGCPGYAGEVFIVIWDSSPSFYEVYLRLGGPDGILTYQEQEK